jgi:hypothetical protein
LWPWAVGALILGTPLVIVIPPLAILAVVVTAIGELFARRRAGTNPHTGRLGAVSLGLLVPTAAYLALALAHVNLT